MTRKPSPRPTAKRASPGRPRKLQFDDIVAAALEVMDEDGYGTLTMRALAAKLGIAHGNLYTYIRHIEDVETAVLQRLLDGLPTPSPTATDADALRASFIDFLHAARRALVRHPRIMQSAIGSQAWHSFSALSLQWIAALDTIEQDGTATAAAYATVISYMASHAERERLYGADYLEQNLRLLNKTLGEARVSPLIGHVLGQPAGETLDRSLDLVIDRLLPKIAAAARRVQRP